MMTARRLALAAAALLPVLVLGARPAAAETPSNDSFSGAVVLSGDLPLTVAGTTVEASKEAGEPDHAGNPGGGSVWYSWTPTADGDVVIGLCAGADFDTLLGVYIGGSVDALTEVAANDDTCGSVSRVEVAATAGVPLAIAVDGWGGQQGSFTLTIEPFEPVVPPQNDDFANAVELTGSLPITATGTTVGATAELGEPDRYWIGDAYHSVWYRWTADITAPVVIDTCDTAAPWDAIAVFTGVGLELLTLLNADVQGCGVTSRLVIDAAVGTTYYIAVDVWDPFVEPGQFELHLNFGAPANDNLGSAVPLGGDLPIVGEGTTDGASQEVYEPDPVMGRPDDAIENHTVWWAWTADTDGPVTIETCGSDGSTVLNVYAGTTYADLTFVTRNVEACGSQSRVTFDAVAGQPYRIEVTGGVDGVVHVVLTIRHPGEPPANDDFADAQPLTGALPIAAYGNNTDATAEPGEPGAGPGGLVTAWYTWTADHTGDVVAGTCGSAFDTVLTVSTGASVDTLTTVASDDDACSLQSQVRFPAVAGTTYHISVDGWNNAQGSFRLALRDAETSPNDNFADAVALRGALPLHASGSTFDATSEPGEPGDYAASGQGASIWYRWTAPATGEVVVEACGSAALTVIGVWTGDAVDAITPAPDQATNRCGDGASIRLSAIAGTTYRISIDGGYRVTDDHGELDLGDVKLTIRRPRDPANDDFANAVVLSGRLPVVAGGSIVDATHEPGEPIPFINAENITTDTSVWFRWTAPSDARVVVETCGSAADVALGVFTGDAVAGLTELDFTGYRSEIPYGCEGGGRVRFTPVAGTTYHFVVAGYADDQGGIRFTLRPESAPANDNLADAAPLRGRLPVAADADTSDATLEPDEPRFEFALATVWYRWTAPSSGVVIADTCRSAERLTSVAVYTGSSLADLSQVGADSGPRCGTRAAARFTAVAGTTYWIALATDSNVDGPVHLELRRPAPPVNDAFGAAMLLRSPTTVRAGNVDTTTESGEPVLGATAGRSVWFRWTAVEGGLVAIDTCGSAINTALAVYTGSSVGALQPVAVSSDGACSGRSLVVFPATAGTTYAILVDGVAFGHGTTLGTEGPIELRFTCDGHACR